MSNEQQRGSTSGNLYRALPSLNDLLLSPTFERLLRDYSRDAVVRSIRIGLKRIRQEISRAKHSETSLRDRLANLSEIIAEDLHTDSGLSLRRVINATGVILHTNLGRAPLSQSAVDHMLEVANGYCNLELDLVSGERGSRDAHVETLVVRVLAKKAGLGEIPATHSALVVNNCAAATCLALNSLAEGREVLISRGELVEIGGGFRIPEILRKSGAFLREVGTTNRTKLSDYERGVSPNTGLILRVHQSNFSMEGFVARPSVSELVGLGRRMNIPVFEDQGTGLFFSLEELGLGKEPTLVESYRQGCDLVAASGDKLLGGPQCGVLVGKRDLIQQIRQNPLFRTYRVDKLTYAALQATLMDHLLDEREAIPVVRMINLAVEEIQRRCESMIGQLNGASLKADVVSVRSVVGGGTSPGVTLPSFAVALRHATVQATALLTALRQLEPPVIGRINEGRVLLDLRTVEPEFDHLLVSLVQKQLPEIAWSLVKPLPRKNPKA
jgi:L-seryl-tRNA(Ser) seleniumtransferase